MLTWPFQQDATLAVQGLGFWLAIVGMLLTLIGFGITLRQLSQARKATEAVTSEVRRIQFAVSKYDATVEMSRAESLLLLAKKSFKVPDWDQAGEAMEEFSKSLHTLNQLKVPELAIHQTDIDNAMTHATRLCERIDRSGNVGLPDADITKILSTIRENDRLLTSVRIALERSAISE